MSSNKLLVSQFLFFCFILTNGLNSASALSPKDSLLLLVNKTDGKDLPVLQNELAFIYYDEGNTALAIEWAQKSQLLAHKTGNKLCEANAYKTIGQCERFNDNYLKAIQSLEIAAELYAGLNDQNKYSDCLSELALCYYTQSKISQAIDYFLKAIKIKEDIKSESAPLYSNAGLAYKEIGLYDKAFELFLKALKIDEQASDTLGMAFDYTNLATIFIKQNKQNQAIDYYKKSYRIFKQAQKKVQVAISSANIGATYFELKNFDKALDYFNESLKIRREINNPRLIAHLCNSLGDFYIATNNYPKAIEFLTEALQISQTIKSDKLLAMSQLNLGIVLKRQKKYTEALNYLEKSHLLAEPQKIYDILPDIYLNISEIWAFKNDYKKSLGYYKKYTTIKDTLANKDREKTLVELEMRFETDKKEQQILLLKKENDLIYEKNARKNSIIIVSFVIIAILILLAYTSYRLYREKKLANDVMHEEFKMINEMLLAQKAAKHDDKPTKEDNNSPKLKFLNSAGTIELEMHCNELLYIVALENYLEIVWHDGEKRQKNVIRNTMKNMEQMVADNDNLVRVHRSFIVNLNHVKQVTGKAQNFKITVNNETEEIPISRNYSKDILSRINKTLYER